MLNDDDDIVPSETIFNKNYDDSHEWKYYRIARKWASKKQYAYEHREEFTKEDGSFAHFKHMQYLKYCSRKERDALNKYDTDVCSMEKHTEIIPTDNHVGGN